ncbi:lysophospholipid acyltransferase family protein [Dyadobacter sp. LHD-138]|uniref:lysophospholipid acyltransferase family protein n=1 Tax=Dyadobacter sp. LHD-138 TaxID=3071413 RepID=UPI0027E02586|nr:lysophospholipid acyltransferase family protein [Dyadobacter sp. LHD-138]MDQ6477437.1 lysophospholipid acyltransferase family protein [Dyadobacter sp. LHD-138]
MNKLVAKISIFFLNSIAGLSWKNVFRISTVLSWLLFDVAGYRKKVISANLRNSFPEKSEEELDVIARNFYTHFTDLILETLKFRTASPEVIRERLEGDLSIINNLYKQNKSAIFLMGHRGNWELANLFSSLEFSHDCIVVYRPLQNKEFDKWFLDYRTRFGAKLVPMDKIFKELLTPRTKPFVVVLANDQSANPKTAFWTKFLHQDTGVFRGVEAIARKLNLPVLYAEFSKIENKRGYYHVDITTITETPKEIPVNGILEKQIQILEQDIRLQPHNWLWSHRRWKHLKPECLKPEQLLSLVP